MKTRNIFTNQEDNLPQGKADFLLATSVTLTCEVENVALTPTLDAELLCNGKVYSLNELPKTPNGVPTPALITRAVHNSQPFSSIVILDLGLSTLPQFTNLHRFDIQTSNSITKGTGIDAKTIFIKGMEFGKTYELRGNYLILGASTHDGTSTAAASCLALGYDCKNDFSSNCLETSSFIENENMSNFEKLSIVSDNMLLFCAGFLLEATRRFHVVLAGGTEMAACLLIAEKVREDVLMRLKTQNLTLATTAWATKDPNSDIIHLLSLLSYTPHAIYTDFSFADTEIDILKKYDEGEVKDGIGVGGALAYACSNGVDNAEILNEIELLIYTI